MKPATRLALVGLAPLVLVGSLLLVATARDLFDPCMTWGDDWGSGRSGGGTSSPDAGGACAGGTRWTTEAPGKAILRASLLPVGTLLVALLAVRGLQRESDRQVGLAIGLAVLVGLPLTISLTMAVASVPALAIAAAARQVGLARRPGTIVAGALTGALGVAISIGALAQGPAVHPVALMMGLSFVGGLLGVAALCLLPS